jgi:hypothetical protein
MRARLRAGRLVAGVALVAALVGVVTTATASQAVGEPNMVPIFATFDDETKTTTYTAQLINPVPGSETAWDWVFAAPPDDPTCNDFRRGESDDKHAVLTYAHGDANGCHHEGKDHNVDITAQALSGPWFCEAKIHGTTPHEGAQPEACRRTSPPPPPPPVTPPPPPPPSPRLTPDEKTALKRKAAVSAGLGLLSGVAGLGLLIIPSPDPLTKGGAGVMFLMGSAELTAAAVWLELAKDPPDPNFKRLAKLSFPRLPPTRAGPRVTRQEALAGNALLGNTARLVGYNDAFLTSLERAQGAHAAGDRRWERTQSQAAARFARAEAKLLDARPALREALRRAVDAALPRARLSVAGAKAATAQVARRALPSSLVSLLRALGFSTAEVASVRSRMAHVSPSAAAGPVTAKLAMPAVTEADRRSARILRAIAARLEAR